MPLSRLGEFIYTSLPELGQFICKNEYLRTLWKEAMSTSEDAQNNQNRLIGTPNLPAINLNVAGIDIGAKHHWVCLLLNRDTENVRRFISGLTGMAIIKAIVVGERDPKVLAALKDRRIKSSATEIAFDFMHIKGTLAYA